MEDIRYRGVRPNRVPYERLSVARKGLVLVAVPLLFHLLFVLIVVGVERQHRQQRSIELRQRQIISTAYRVLGLMVDAETGMRGYVLSGKEVFLEPYWHAEIEFPRQFAQLRSMAGGSGESQSIDALDATAKTALAFQEQSIAGMRANHAADVVARINRLEGKRRVDAFRAAMQKFLVTEEQLASAADRRSTAAQLRLYVALSGGLVFDVLLAITLSIFFTRSIAARLSIVTENTMRVERQEPLAPVLAPGDEIAALDARLHQMAATIETARTALIEANSELAAFSYSISHDLRAPVRAVDGYGRMLEEDYGDRLDGEGKRFLLTIRAEARRMGRLIDDLLAFSKLTRTDAADAPVDMASLAREVVEQVHRDAVKTAAEFRIGDLPVSRGDRPMLRQVLTNFVSNAVKFSGHAEHPLIEIGGERRNGENVYWVRDNGVGFDMRYAGKLFGVFQRLHRSDEFEGTGVGLAIAQRVVVRHGGRVWAESSPGAGASFFFTLPARQESEVRA
jgi:signal transduction histidine kinase